MDSKTVKLKRLTLRELENQLIFKKYCYNVIKLLAKLMGYISIKSTKPFFYRVHFTANKLTLQKRQTF